VQPIAFLYYDETQKFMQSLGIAFCLVILLFCPLYNIANSEFLASFQIVSKFINNKQGNTNRSKLLIYRWALFAFSCSFALITDKIEIILNLAGVIVIPILSFWLPVSCVF